MKLHGCIGIEAGTVNDTCELYQQSACIGVNVLRFDSQAIIPELADEVSCVRI
ncbi:hypothetical protein [Sulfitobacter sp. HGT1]|uniref:hypothetical protein n=1 Tax=Sulfitobacter sp. HGT1 TaxID=2735435 RepID=UPI0015945B4B|nr:hypothetical protein [Sulfitobacter sp. HGT1]